MHRNPLISQYDFKQYEHILYYKVEKMSILKHKKKKFKFVDGKNNIPMILLEPEADKNK